MLEVYKIIFGYISVAITLLSFVLYFYGIIKGQTKPHAFSWLIWTLLTGTIFIIQVLENGGAGAWSTGTTTITTFIVAIMSFYVGDRHFTRFDWFALLGALMGIGLWLVTKNPLLAVIIITLTDGIGYLPSFRKGFYKPNEEIISMYLINNVRYVISLMALSSYSLSVWLYPVALTFFNTVYSIFIFWRRKKLNQPRDANNISH